MSTPASVKIKKPQRVQTAPELQPTVLGSAVSENGANSAVAGSAGLRRSSSLGGEHSLPPSGWLRRAAAGLDKPEAYRDNASRRLTLLSLGCRAEIPSRALRERGGARPSNHHDRLAGRRKLGSPNSMNFIPWKKMLGGYQSALGLRVASFSLRK